MKKKTIILVFIFSAILIIMGISFYFYEKYKNAIEVHLTKNLKVEVNSVLNVSDLFDMIKNGKISSDTKTVDTSILGSKSIKITLINNYGKKEDYSFTLKIVDTIQPIINFKSNLNVDQGNILNLLDGVSATDNSNEKLVVKVEGYYDFNKFGSYKLYYVCSDSSNNITKEEFILTVNAKPTTSKGYILETNNGVTYINGIIIVNKTYSLPSNYGNGLTNETQNAFNKMKSDASAEGIVLKIISGFRSYSSQVSIYNAHIERAGKIETDKVSAAPGHSEHQTGLAVDINLLKTSFINTKEGIWLNNNAYKYGFILRYPESKTNLTGYSFEPWHYRYVGTNLSQIIYNNGDWISLEEYFGITSIYND